MKDRQISSRLRHLTIFSPGVSNLFTKKALTGIGGAERQTFQIANSLAKHGVRVKIITINNKDKSSIPRIELYEAWRSPSSWITKFIGFARSLLVAHSPIYVRISRPNVSNAVAVVFSRILGKRVVVGLASDLMCVPRSWHSIDGMLWRLILRRASLVIAQTKSQQCFLSRSPRIRTHIFGNTVNLGDYAVSSATNFTKRDIDVLWIGSIDPRKDLETVVRIALKLPKTRISILGGPVLGFEEYYSRMRHQFSGVHNIDFGGFINPDQLPTWLARARMLLHTAVPVTGSFLKEGFPNVMLEAWASGLPVVSTMVDPDGLISKRGLGIYCSGIEESIEAIQMLTHNQTLWSSIRKLSLEYAASRDINNQNIVDEIVDLLTSQP